MEIGGNTIHLIAVVRRTEIAVPRIASVVLRAETLLLIASEGREVRLEDRVAIYPAPRARAGPAVLVASGTEVVLAIGEPAFLIAEVSALVGISEVGAAPVVPIVSATAVSAVVRRIGEGLVASAVATQPEAPAVGPRA